MAKRNAQPGTKFVTRAEFAKAPSTSVLLRKSLDTSVQPGDAGTRILRFAISTNGVDRDGDVIAPGGWDLRNYLKSPVVLWAHQYDQLPVGKASNVKVDGDRLMADVEFVPAETYAFADTVYRMLKGGFLGGTSVGFKPKTFKYNEKRQGFDFAEQELLEFSVVPIPANPDALLDARAAGVLDEGDVDRFREWVEKSSAALKAVWSTEYVNNLPDSSFAYIEPGGSKDGDGKTAPRSLRHLPYKDADGKVDPAHCRNALARLPQTQGIPDGERPKIEAKLRAALDSIGGGDKSIASATMKAFSDRAAAWAAPTLAAFTAKAWDNLSAAEREKIAGHYAWATSMPPDTFEALDFPHHDAETGDVSWLGLAAAMGDLLAGKNSEVPDAQRQDVYQHLANHYAAFGAEPPKFEKLADAREIWISLLTPDAFKVMPTPNDGEAEQDFVSRCMGSEVMRHDYADDKQRAAVCYAQYRRHKASAAAEPKSKAMAGCRAGSECPMSPDMDECPRGNECPMNMGEDTATVTEGVEALVAKTSALVNKVGRVLAARNESRLRQATALLTEVLTELDKTPGASDAPKSAEPAATPADTPVVKSDPEPEPAFFVLVDDEEPSTAKDSVVVVAGISDDDLRAAIVRTIHKTVEQQRLATTGELD